MSVFIGCTGAWREDWPVHMQCQGVHCTISCTCKYKLQWMGRIFIKCIIFSMKLWIRSEICHKKLYINLIGKKGVKNWVSILGEGGDRSSPRAPVVQITFYWQY